MADIEIRRRSAVEGRLESGDYGAVAGDGPGLILKERPALAIAQVEAWAETADETVEKIAKTVGVRPSRAPLSAVVSGETTALWVGPDSWLIVEPESARTMLGLVETLEAELGGQAALTDQGHGRVCLRISGPALTTVLAKGCTLDLDPGRDFDPGRVVGTALGHMTVTMHRLDVETADLYVARSFAVSFLDWLMHAAAEYGVRMVED